MTLKLLTRIKFLLCSIIVVFGLAISTQGMAFSTTFSNLFFPVDFKGDSGKSAAAAKAQAQYGGKVLSVSESKSNGQTVYKVKLLLDSGRIKIVKVKG